MQINVYSSTLFGILDRMLWDIVIKVQIFLRLLLSRAKT